MIQVLLSEVRMSGVGGSPLMLLREAEGRRELAVWINANAGAAILSALEGEREDDHPSTHDLLIETLSSLDAVVEAVHLLDCDEGIFNAELVVNGIAVTCRASDGVALALRCGAPILATEELLEEYGVWPDAAAEPEAGLGDTDDQVEQFREFLESINPDDFTEGGEERP